MRRVVVVAVLGLACFLAPMAAAYGLWTSSATGTMNVSTAGTTLQPPAAPVLSCGSLVKQGEHTMTWPAVATATSYNVYRSLTTNAPASFTLLTSGATSPYTSVAPAGQSTAYYRLKAANAAGEGAFSNTLRVIRDGSSTTCAAVSP